MEEMLGKKQKHCRLEIGVPLVKVSLSFFRTLSDQSVMYAFLHRSTKK